MDSRVTVRQSLVLAMAELSDLDSRLSEIKKSVFSALKLLESCPHPLDARQELHSFGDFETYMCGVCNEIRHGR